MNITLCFFIGSHLLANFSLSLTTCKSNSRKGRGNQPQDGMTMMECSPPGKEFLRNKKSSHYSPAHMSSLSFCFYLYTFHIFFPEAEKLKDAVVAVYNHSMCSSLLHRNTLGYVLIQHCHCINRSCAFSQRTHRHHSQFSKGWSVSSPNGTRHAQEGKGGTSVFSKDNRNVFRRKNGVGWGNER